MGIQGKGSDESHYRIVRKLCLKEKEKFFHFSLDVKKIDNKLIHLLIALHYMLSFGKEDEAKKILN